MTGERRDNFVKRLRDQYKRDRLIDDLRAQGAVEMPSVKQISDPEIKADIE